MFLHFFQDLRLGEDSSLWLVGLPWLNTGVCIINWPARVHWYALVPLSLATQKIDRWAKTLGEISSGKKLVDFFILSFGFNSYVIGVNGINKKKLIDTT